jgi:lysophospholipase L1-like esterase
LRLVLLLRSLASSAALVACGNAASNTRAIPPLSESLVEAPSLARPAGPPEARVAAAAPTDANASGAASTHFLDHPEALRRFFSSLEGLEKGGRGDDVRVVQFGDSHTAADYQTGPLRRSLQKRFGDGGRGFVSLGRPWKFYTQEGVQQNGMSGWSPERGRYAKGKFVGDGRYGLVGVSIAASQAGARAYTDLSAQAARVELAYLEAPRGGSFEVLIDGARVKRVRTSAPEARSAYLSLEVPEGPHRLELSAVGDGTVRVFGVNLDRPRFGITLDAFGVNGARAADLLRLDEQHFAGELRHRDPSLVVLAYGTNESSDDVPIDAVERQVVDVLGRVARAVPTASCLLLGPPDRAVKRRVVVAPDPGAVASGAVGAESTLQTVWTTPQRLLDVAAMERKVAAAAGCAYYSQLDAMGGPGAIAGWANESPPRAMLDRTHLSRQGYAELGDAFASEILQSYDAYRGRLPPEVNVRAASAVPPVDPADPVSSPRAAR